MRGFRWPWQRPRTRVKMAPFDSARLPRTREVSFDEMLEEGLLMAESAGRMALKNRLIVRALRGDEPLADEAAAAAARDVLYELVQEADEVAEHVAEEREAARKREGRSEHQHDYHRDDLLNLRRREKVHAAVAKELWTRRSDDAYIARMVDRAREDAWGELGAAIEQALDRTWARYDEEPDYAVRRGDRMAFVGEDLRRDLARIEAQRAVEAIPEY
ncbi:hypothetical protein [Agromyces marinus]|uniref:Asparagine synthase n=1 Tax=Agromyces marinus TaxID=1389020 RepID=A0ABM8H1K3_9MICO|nr:hypothetical protein [Agromyces marinus]UIP57242.1 hypothetical protein DSM26151_00970 [Agromyces marinus]BDZ54669.1 hypothetical protein GCM10025870_17420 [Agromyces marinus]